MPNNAYQNLIIIFFVSIVGFLAGILGSLVVENYRFDNLNKDLPKQISIFNQRDKVIEDVSIDLLNKNIVGIILPKESSPSALDVYSHKDIVAYGFILTDDGWIVSADNKKFYDEKENCELAVITSDGNILQIEEQETDSVANVVFFKVNNKDKEFLAMKLGDSDKLNLLDELISVDLYGNAINHSVVNLKKSNTLIHSSEKVDSRIIVSQKSIIGLPLINVNSEIVGIMGSIDGDFIKIIPVNYFTNQISHILKTGKLSRVFLGVSYINLDKFSKNVLSEGFIQHSRGALIYSLNKNTSVIKGSPADIAGLKYKDIIISIEGEEVGPNKNLSEIIQEYKTDVKIKMEILRNGQKKELKVNLSEIKF